MMSTSLRGLVTAAFLVCAAQASAHDYQLGPLSIDRPWARPTLGQVPNSAGYMTIRNDGAEADRLLEAESPVAAEVEVHESRVENGTVQMRPLEGGLELPPGQTVTLEPGGYHLMITGLKRPLRPGDHVPVDLLFEHGGTLQIEFLVQPLGAGQPMPGMDHGAKPAG